MLLLLIVFVDAQCVCGENDAIVDLSDCMCGFCCLTRVNNQLSSFVLVFAVVGGDPNWELEDVIDWIFVFFWFFWFAKKWSF